jgi:uncharacterized RDD family membrane protein YckC
MGNAVVAGTQRESAHPIFAGFWRRALAFTIDAIVIGGITFLLALVFGSAGAALSGFAIFVAYSAGFEGSVLQATPGKLALGLRVADVDEVRLGWVRSVMRTLLKLVSAGSGGAGFAVAAFTPLKQAIHDLMASTVVLRARR